ncbi:xylulokinase [Robertkochia solimangrovi]|uniref:xylulokinase n=1 Tax=Robertkochia solimangrovi TaxID=2213046 RepID=UPI001180D839|nr:FGGY family carbohydrate kinase [Robertkochia solimangrovi]TRZ42502.1 carbohydrate kinase [Robertkochia solimangrovi]
MYWIGFDLGSSSIKAALIRSEDGKVIAVTQYPETEMHISSPEIGWGEQDPELWWENACIASRKLIEVSGVASGDIKGIGISYQMHGLVLVDKAYKVIRPSIIWCDSRAVSSGDALFELAGEERCLEHLLNSPGNFTLAKLKWVKDHEPETFAKIYKYMLPGDFLALRLTGECITTPSGLSEGIAYDFKSNNTASWLLELAGISPELVPEIRPSFSEQGRVTKAAANVSGLPEGIPVMYRAGDQPNNALALNVLEPGQIAATGGTSGVVYAITDQVTTTESVRINSFAHVNHSPNAPRIGKMLCINGTGIQYSWMRSQVSGGKSYNEMNELAATVPVGSEGLCILPYGNGAERMLRNQYKGARISNLNFNVHHQAHLFRAALEGIAFSFVYGMEILAKDGANIQSIKAGNDNLFRAGIFSNTISILTNARIDIVETTGAVGAARAAAYASGAFKSFDEAVQTDKVQLQYEPDHSVLEQYKTAYNNWKQELKAYIN